MAAKKPPKVSSVVSKRGLTSYYDSYIFMVLYNEEYLKELQRTKRKEMRKYKVLKKMPTKEEYEKARDKKFTVSVKSLITDAVEELESLRDELQEWYDNLPENLQCSSKGEMLEEATGYLDEVEEPYELEKQIPDNVKALYYPDLNCNSRSSRCGAACAMLETARDTLEEIDDEKYKDIIEEIDNMKDTCEGVEFPGMY